MDIHIITIGDELLIGQVVDTNSAWLAQHFNAMAIGTVKKIFTISDQEDTIFQTIKNSFKEASLVIITGGLGPTKDDITKKVLADFFKDKMVFNEALYLKIRDIFKNWAHKNVKITKEQFFFPSQTTLLTNKMGTAPGMWFEKDEKVLISLPGVPFEMKYIMETSGFEKLSDKYENDPVVHRTIKTVGIGEGKLSEKLETYENNLPKDVGLAYLPSIGEVRLRLTIQGSDLAQITQKVDIYKNKMVNILGDFVYGFENESLAQVVGKLLLSQKKTIGFAESCTGGYLSHLITSVPGASQYFEGSAITYSNTQKENLLSVSPEILKKHGAVSQATVEAMVKGVLNHLKTDVAVSISGIAGPDGGTPDKPVGTIWFAIGDSERIISRKIQLQKDRIKNIQYSGIYALNLIRQFLQEII